MEMASLFPPVVSSASVAFVCYSRVCVCWFYKLHKGRKAFLFGWVRRAGV